MAPFLRVFSRLVSRAGSALLSVPLVVCGPFLRAARAKERHARVRAARAAQEAKAAPSAPSGADMPPVALMRAMRDELRKELAASAARGRVHAHLARFERHFSKRGVRAIDEIPIDQLRRALREFEAMVRNWSSPPLADLRSRMAVRLADRASAATMWIAVNSVAPSRHAMPAMAARLAQAAPAILRQGARNAFHNSQQLSIGEVSLSHFEAAGGRPTT